MKFHKQLHRHDPANGVYGDCQRTVLACLLDLKEPEAVPHFNHDGCPDGVFWDRLDGWLRKKGFARWQVYFPGDIALQDVLQTMGRTNPGMYYQLAGKSPRNTQHVVICVGDAILHDPHPDGGGIVAPDDTNGMWNIEVLVPLRFTAKRALTISERWWLAYTKWKYRSNWLRYLGVSAAKRRGRRWGDHDRQWGPFTYSRPDYPNIGFVLCSGSSGQRPYARLRLGTRTLLCELPKGTVRPWRKWVEMRAKVTTKSGPDGYWRHEPCEYGLNIHKSGAVGSGYDFLSIHYGVQSGSSDLDKSWTCFLPWMDYRHVRDTYLATDGSVWHNVRPELPPIKWPWTNRRKSVAWDRWRTRRDMARDQERELDKHCPTVTYRFKDYDGEELTAKCRLYESEWRRGENLFRWMGALWKPVVIRRLNVVFSGETGNRKGSWKGGTLESTGPTRHTGSVEAAFRTYCDEHRMEFLGPVEESETVA